MSLKRRNSDQISPVKRRRCDSNVSETPVQYSSSLFSSVSSSSRLGDIPATPYTPYPLQPSDSPTNPFKGKRKVESLPPVTSFSKHIALRFQFHRRGVGFHKGGVHRIVQVPLNYTFTHLRALIAWLFNTPSKCTNGKVGKEGYLFEVKTNIAMESTLMKPGMIKNGVTSVKASNAKDPWRQRYGQNAEDEDELDDESEADAEDEDCGPSVSDDWVWADEDDYTLAHVWITGVRADRGIIYHHSWNTQIHITANATKLPRRRGRSNVPYVFSAQGRVHLFPPPLPRPVFTQSILHTLSSSPVGPSIPRCTGPVQNESPERKTFFSPGDHSPEVGELSDPNPDDGSDTENIKLFSDDHPFFCSSEADDQDVRVSSSKKFAHIGVSPDDGRRKIHSPEVIYVGDSDDENELQNSEDEESEDETVEVYDRCIDPDRWNESHYAYGRYLLSFLDGRGRSFDHIDDEHFEEQMPYDPFDDDDGDEVKVKEPEYVEEGSMECPIEIEDDADEVGARSSTPELTSSSTRQTSPLPPSSPPIQQLSSSPAWQHDPGSERSDESFNLSSSIDPLSLSPNSSLELHPGIIALHYPNKKYTITPAPPRARKHRLRLERLEKRLERVKKGKYLCACDEVNEKPKDEEEVDELREDDEEEEEDERYVRPILKEGEVWDPFGDEVEI